MLRTRIAGPEAVGDQMKSAIEAMTPLGRLAEADEVADAVLYLASDAAAMVTGHTLPVDGGWVAR